MTKQAPRVARAASVAAAVLALPIPPGAAVAGQDPAALVVRVEGHVSLHRAGHEPAPAAVGSRLAVGDEVVPTSGSRAMLITRTGATLAVTAATTVAAPPGGGSPGLFERAVATLAQVATADVRGAGGRQGMIRPIPGEPTLVAPRAGLTVTSTRPTFRWMAVEDAPGYTLQLRRTDGGAPVRFEVGPRTEWTLPPDLPPLLPGAAYSWTVAPPRGRPAREERFQVIGPEAYGELAAALDEVSALGVDPGGDGLFLAAVVYRELGLLYDAHAALAGLSVAGEFTAELYLLKGEILSRLGMADEARAAFDRADALLR